jgi:hypothetical protein
VSATLARGRLAAAEERAAERAAAAEARAADAEADAAAARELMMEMAGATAAAADEQRIIDREGEAASVRMAVWRDKVEIAERRCAAADAERNKAEKGAAEAVGLYKFHSVDP